MTDHKQQIQTQLWNIANDLRGNMGADEFRDYILGFIFYKYLSEKVELWADRLLQHDGIRYRDLATHTNSADLLADLRHDSVDALGFFLAPQQLFTVLAQKGNEHAPGHENLLADLEMVFRFIESSVAGTDSEEDFDGLFDEIDLDSSKLGKKDSDKRRLIGKVLMHLDKIDFKLEDSSVDVLGDAYEYLISQFASGAGKKAGEFYTPQEVSSILARLVTSGKTKLKSVYDPTCGSGSLLLRVAKEVSEVGMFYGQEMNRTTFNLARMNMLLHDVSYRFFNLEQDDTLEEPRHKGMQFEAVVANPPFSAKWSAKELFMDDDRFGAYGKLAPSSKADYAFVTHMLHHLSEDGIMAVVLPHGALFRGAAEGHIRKHIIKQYNWLDAVIGLPANIFYGTSIPTCIMVFRKDRKSTDSVLFIDASEGFEKVKNQNYLREQDIDKIVTAYRERREEDKYSHNATLAELKENDYNLNIPRYVDTFEEEEQIDLIAVQEEIKSLDAELAKVEEELNNYLKELGL